MYYFDAPPVTITVLFMNFIIAPTRSHLYDEFRIADGIRDASTPIFQHIWDNMFRAQKRTLYIHGKDLVNSSSLASCANLGVPVIAALFTRHTSLALPFPLAPPVTIATEFITHPLSKPPVNLILTPT